MKVRYDYQQVFIDLSVEEAFEFLNMLDDYTGLFEGLKEGTVPEDLKERFQRLKAIVKTTKLAFDEMDQERKS